MFPIVTDGNVTDRKKWAHVYSLPKITNPTPPVCREDLKSLFPDYEVSSLVHPSSDIDILLSSDWFGLHPKTEVAKSLSCELFF